MGSVFDLSIGRFIFNFLSSYNLKRKKMKKLSLFFKIRVLIWLSWRERRYEFILIVLQCATLFVLVLNLIMN